MPVTDEMVCFSLYAASRATTQAYRSMLEPWGLTYPQYLVLVTLWIEGDQTVSGLGDHLQLDSGTLSPLLRRMEQGDLVRRARRSADERVVTVTIGDRGAALRSELAHIPARIAAGTGLADEQAAVDLIATLHRLTETMHAAAAAAAAACPETRPEGRFSRSTTREPSPTPRLGPATDPHEGRNHHGSPLHRRGPVHRRRP